MIQTCEPSKAFAAKTSKSFKPDIGANKTQSKLNNIASGTVGGIKRFEIRPISEKLPKL